MPLNTSTPVLDFLSLVRDRLFPGGLGKIVQAFTHRNYRIYAAGNAVSLTGVWMQRVAVGWLAWSLTHSGTWLGIVSMAEFFPVVFLSPLAGALADRRDRVGIIRVTQIAGSIEASLLAVLVYTGAITIELLFGLTLLLGIFNAVAQPSRLALIPTLVDRAGTAFAVGDQRDHLQLRAVSRAGSRRRHHRQAQRRRRVHGECGDLRRLPHRDDELARDPCIAGRRDPGCPQGLGGSLWLREPASRDRADAVAVHDNHDRHSRLRRAVSRLCRQRVRTRPEGLATLTSTVGLGAIFGAGWMLLRPAVSGLTALVLGNTLMISLAILGFTLTDRFTIALPCVFLAGTAMTITGVGAQTLIQAAVDIRMRGRIMALYGMIFRAGPALGAVLMGSLSERFGLRLPLAVGALVSCAFWAWTRLKQKRIAETLETDPSVLLARQPS